SVFVVDACRTPIGKIKGALAQVRPDHLAADVITALTGRNPWLDVTAIDDVYWGAANQAGEDNRNVARMAVLLAGLPVEIPGATVNRLCGSGMEAVCDAARTIAAGEADVCLAGGSESMTRAPFVLGRSADAFPRAMDLADTRLGWRLVSPRMQELYPPITLGETAENVAEKYGITRERQDEWALRSHQRAAAARDAGRFDAETAPVTTPRGEVRHDEGINGGITAAELAAKRPAFRTGGTVTGGHSSPLNDGAAAAGALRGRLGGWRPSGLHGDRAGARHEPGPAPGRLAAGRAGPRRGQRGVRRAGGGGGRRAQLRSGPGQRERRRDRDRASAGVLRGPDRHHLAARDAPARRGPRRGQHVHRRRPGHRLALGSRLTRPKLRQAGRACVVVAGGRGLQRGGGGVGGQRGGADE